MEKIWMPAVATMIDGKLVWGLGPSTPMNTELTEKHKKKVWGIAHYNLKLKRRKKAFKSRRRNGRLLAK